MNFFQFNSSLAQHFTSNDNLMPIHATEFITSLMLSHHNAIRRPKQSAKQNPQDLQCHGHDSSTHVARQSQVITNTCRAFVLILCVITGVLGIWHIMNQRYVLTFLMFLYISNLSYIHPGNSESSTI